MKAHTANIVLAIGGLTSFVSTEVQNSTFVLRISVSAKNPAHRQYAARYTQAACRFQTFSVCIFDSCAIKIVRRLSWHNLL